MEVRKNTTKSLILNIMELYGQFAANMSVNTAWWPAENAWEIAVGAVLVQNTNWRNVEKSLDNIREALGFDPQIIAEAQQSELIELIRPSGFYTNKSQTIHDLFQWFQQDDFILAKIAEKSASRLRKELLNIRGIGPETADVLLLFIFDKPVFIADKYAQRLFNRLGIKENLSYQKLQSMVQLPEDFSAQQAKNLHGWIIEYGKVYLASEEVWCKGFLADFFVSQV